MSSSVATTGCLVALAFFAAVGCADILGFEPAIVGTGGGGDTGGGGNTNTGGTNTGGTNTGGTSNGGTSTGGNAPSVLTFGGPGEDYAYAIAASPVGALVGGSFTGTAKLGPALELTSGSFPDAFAFEADPLLSVENALQIGAKDPVDGLQVITAVAANAAGEVAVAGYFTGSIQSTAGTFASFDGSVDLFVAKRNADGTLAWLRGFGGSGTDVASSVAFLPTGDVAVAGSVQDMVSFDSDTPTPLGEYDAAVLKLDANNGVVKWAYRFGGATVDMANAMVADAAGRLTVAGSYEGDIAFPGSTPLGFSGGGTDAFVVHFDATGTPVWKLGLGDAQTQRALALAVDPTTLGIYVAGGYLGNMVFGATRLSDVVGEKDVPNVFVARLEEADGYPIWAKAFADTGQQQAGELGLAARSTGIACVGHFSSGANFGDGIVVTADVDGFIVEMSGEGAYQSSRFIRGAGSQRARAVAFGPSGEAYVAGDFEGTPVFDGVPFPPAAVSDGFLMKISP